MGRIVKYTGSFSRPADVTAYAAGDEVASSATAGSVVRATLDMSGVTRGRFLFASMDITPASGNVVITAANFKILVFKTVDAPAAVGDNVTFPIAAATRQKLVAGFLMDDGGWENPLGAYTASTSAIQVCPAMTQIPLATPTLAKDYPFAGCFDFTGDKQDNNANTTARQMTVCLQALAAWTPLAVVNAFGFSFTVEIE